MGTVLLATDGSEYAQHAAKRAIEIAESEGATLHAVCVVDERRFTDPAISSAGLATVYAEDHAATGIEKVAEMASDRNVTVEGDTLHEIPHEVILDYADDVDADVIVIGEHGDHDEHFSGVGRKLTALADREVIVVEADS